MKILKIYESSKDSKRRLISVSQKNRMAKKDKNLSCKISLDKNQTFQTIKGFGCSITESAGYVLSFLSEKKRKKVIESCFSQSEKCNCYNFARTHMNSCDFSLENWSCLPEKDESLESFSFERTDKYITPALKLAIQAFMQSSQASESNEESEREAQVIVTPWSPPAWMKTNNDMNHGGKLKPEYKKLWAEYYVKFIKGLEERGIKTSHVSIQNEPEASQTWDSCLWTGKEEADFSVKYLKPVLMNNNLKDVKILIWDHNRDRMLERLKESFSVPGAEAAIDGIAFHWYSGDQYENLAACSEILKDKELFFTEGCIEGGSRPGKWYVGERYGHNIINDLNNGCTAWIDWNMALDIEGGPNHVGNNCDAPILIDTKSGKVIYQSSYYYMGHFSRFIRPLSKRIDCQITPFMTPATVDGRMGNTMETSAFLRPDGKIVLVVMNRTEDDMIFELNLQDCKEKDKSAKIEYNSKVSDENSGRTFVCPPRSIQTYIIEDK